MVVSVWKTSAVALAMVVLTPLVALAQEGKPAQPPMQRAPGNDVQANDAQATDAWSFQTGLADGVDATYEFMRAIEYSEQLNEQDASRETFTENVSMLIRVASDGPRPDGITPVVATFERFRARIETPEGPVSVDFDLNRDLPEDAGTFTGLDAMLPALKNAEVQLLVDANGNVNAIQGLPDVASLLAENPADAALFGVLEQGQFAILFSKLFNAEGGVERTSAMGATRTNTWTTVEEVPMGPSGDLLITRAWTPTRLDTGEIESRGAFAASMDAPENPSDAAPVCNIGSYSGVSRMLWQETGGLSYLNATEIIALELTLGAQSVRTAQQTVTTISRLED